MSRRLKTREGSGGSFVNGVQSQDYDVVIVGAGPVGCLCAVAHARKGVRVALLEANPKSSRRMAGEWLHPPAVKSLRRLGIALEERPLSTLGRGFVVVPRDGIDPITLPYANGSVGLSCEHETIVETLRDAVEEETEIDVIYGRRVRTVEDGRVTFLDNGTERSVTAARIVGADGRASTVRRSLGVSTHRMTCSRMIGITVRCADLSLAGYGYVVLGGPGPIFMYQLGEHCVRVIVDVPLDQWNPRDRIGFLADSYTGLMPEGFDDAFVDELQAGRFDVATNEFMPRVTYGCSGRVLIGDAAGHYHPMTASGITLGFGDALALAELGDFRDFTSRRFRATHSPEFLAMGLYEAFTDHRPEAEAVRRAIYRRWRANPAFRTRTMRLLACEETSPSRLASAGGTVLMKAVAREFPLSTDRQAWRRAHDTVRALVVRGRWLTRAALRLRRAKGARREDDRTRDSLVRAFRASLPTGVDDADSLRAEDIAPPNAAAALGRASARMIRVQAENGSWEGEVVWCPMLTSQYVLLHHVMGCPIDPGRRRRLLRLFERTRLKGGAWGLHDHSQPHLFVTTLVYVAARVLGAERDDPLVAPALRFLRAEGVLNIPSWGKFWLAVLNLYEWRGVNVILPELWSLPRWVPLHPANWYCHTRLIYMAMTAVYAARFQAPVTQLTASLRKELFSEPFTDIDFSKGCDQLRDNDLFARPSRLLRIGFGFAGVFDRLHPRGLRARCVDSIVGRIRWELRSTEHASISPVSGMLNILALWLHDPDDADCRRALNRLDGWIWEDEEDGTRVTGARSSSWDTGLSLQALATVRDLAGVKDALRSGADHLSRQQIGVSFDGFVEAFRADPNGGWCFSRKGHGWPVSDCTAEAVLGILDARPDAAPTAMLRDAVAFMLRSQNRDGGFGSYEAQRSRVPLEWLNPAEMFGDCMTEHSYVECTASCLAALAACRARAAPLVNSEMKKAVARAEAWLRRTQASDGSWRGVWGIQFIYGTMFGIRGLVAAGARPGHPALRLACRWLLDRQRPDGGWGEHHSGSTTGRYIPHETSQVVQTAWALIALLVASDSNWSAISRGARLLLNSQKADGSWPSQDMNGVFFRTALLEYKLYRDYFPLQALGLYEQRRRNRLGLLEPARFGQLDRHACKRTVAA